MMTLKIEIGMTNPFLWNKLASASKLKFELPVGASFLPENRTTHTRFSIAER